MRRNRSVAVVVHVLYCIFMFVVTGNFHVHRTWIEIRFAFPIRTLTMKYQGERLAHLMQRCYLQTFKKYGMADKIKV